MRLDKFLKVSRLIKRRTVANEACDAGRVLVNGKVAKASVDVKVGDEIEIGFGTRSVKVRVLDVQDTVKKEAAKQIRKITETPKKLATATVEEKIIQKPFTLRGLYSLILKHSDEGLPEAKIYEYFKVQEEDLRFVLDYLEYKGFFRHDTMSKWFAVPDLAKDPMLMKTLVGLRNSAILNREFKKKAIRSNGK